MEEGEEEEEVGGLVGLCIEAASASAESVERWRRQRRTLERLPYQIADALLRRLRSRRLLFPSLLEVFQHCVEEVDLKGETCVDAEWMAYLGAFRYLRSLNIADCRRVNNSAIWPLTGMHSLKELDLSRCSKITDAGIKHLVSLQSLEKLCISETGVTADGVMLLSSLQNLRVLDIGGVPVTDAALHSLQVLTQLEYLDLWGSKISDNGAAKLELFPKLSFLNLAWTSVTTLPNLPSITYLNMSNCTIHSIFNKECRATAPLLELVLSGATFVDVDEAFSNVEASYLTFLDMSGSPISNISFLINMKRLEYVDLSFSRITDSLVEYVANVGATLRELNLSNTRLTLQGMCILAGSVMNLHKLSLSGTGIDDASLSYIARMPSLKVIDLSHTNIKGFAYQGKDSSDKILSLSELQSLSHLQSLNLEETQVRDEALHPLSLLGELTCLYLKSDFLSDISLHALSALRKLKFLGFRGAVLTNTGLVLYTPPPLLHVLDLRGCWLLAENVLSSFCKSYPQLDVRHECIEMFNSLQNASVGSSPLHKITRASRLRKKGSKSAQASRRFSKVTFVDERLKYSREELLELQFSPLASLALRDRNLLPQMLRKE